MKVYELLALFALASLVAGPAAAAIDTARVSPDITVDLGGQVVTDEDVAEDDLSGNITLQDIGVIPAGADLMAYHLLGNGDQLLVFDTTVTLPGAVIAQPRDVVRYDGANYSIEFDGSSLGVPTGARIDAVTVDGSGNLLLSFNITVDLPVLIADDEDLVRFDGVEEFGLFFDGSAAGLAAGLDLDAAHFDGESGNILLSFDSGGLIGGVPFADEDILEHDPMGATWSLAYDGSAEHAAWLAGDLVAAFVAFLGELIFQDGFENL